MPYSLHIALEDQRTEATRADFDLGIMGPVIDHAQRLTDCFDANHGDRKLSWAAKAFFVTECQRLAGMAVMAKQFVEVVEAKIALDEMADAYRDHAQAPSTFGDAAKLAGAILSDSNLSALCEAAGECIAACEARGAHPDFIDTSREVALVLGKLPSAPCEAA